MAEGVGRCVGGIDWEVLVESHTACVPSHGLQHGTVRRVSERCDRLDGVGLQPQSCPDGWRVIDGISPVLANSSSADQDVAARQEGENGAEQLRSAHDSITRSSCCAAGRKALGRHRVPASSDLEVCRFAT